MGGAFFVLCRCLCRAVVLRQPFSCINVVATMRLPCCGCHDVTALQDFYGQKKRRIMRLFDWGGTDGNRTSDTRIFSPLLYQLSYGTSVLRCKITTFFVCGNKNSSK